VSRILELAFIQCALLGYPRKVGLAGAFSSVVMTLTSSICFKRAKTSLFRASDEKFAIFSSLREFIPELRICSLFCALPPAFPVGYSIFCSIIFSFSLKAPRVMLGKSAPSLPVPEVASSAGWLSPFSLLMNLS